MIRGNSHYQPNHVPPSSNGCDSLPIWNCRWDSFTSLWSIVNLRIIMGGQISTCCIDITGAEWSPAGRLGQFMCTSAGCLRKEMDCILPVPPLVYSFGKQTIYLGFVCPPCTYYIDINRRKPTRAIRFGKCI